MKCNVIKDLLPLYVDDCCSEESSQLVQEHLKGCEDCQRAYNTMSRKSELSHMKAPVIKLRRVSEWKASILQSLLLFISFAIITLGVWFEAATPSGLTNGLWAMALVIPATGNLLSLANWYFVRLYINRKTFSNFSCLFTLLLTVAGYAWALLHYDDGIILTSPLVIVGAVLSIVFIVLSKVLSNQYALLLGRE